jgi:hypothetical protein
MKNLLLLFLLLPFLAFAQETKKEIVYIEDIYKVLYTDTSYALLKISDKIIKSKGGQTEYRTRNLFEYDYRSDFTSTKKENIVHKIYRDIIIDNCEIKCDFVFENTLFLNTFLFSNNISANNNIIFINCKLENKCQFDNSTLRLLKFAYCDFSKVDLSNKNIEVLSIYNCVFNNLVDFWGNYSKLWIFESEFKKNLKIKPIIINELIINQATCKYPVFLDLNEIKSVSIQSSLFYKNINLHLKKITEFISFKNNKIYKNIVFGNINYDITASNFDVDWDDVSNFKISLSEEYLRKINIDNNKSIIHNKNIHLSLISVYQTFYNFYKFRGDIESANAVYVEMKDIQTRRLKYLYEQDGKLKSWFKWRLNSLMKLYTEHGTDPAKALVISFYIILVFAIFYFFFPSDWDMVSKTEMFKQFKTSFAKTTPNKFMALGSVLVVFIVSVLNAITLSINAFVTLGFGNIPTHGVAKYFTVIQGFLGWFLLSLFSVALINQVLF